MVTELVAGEVAEKGVVDFAQICEVATPDDVSNQGDKSPCSTPAQRTTEKIVHE